MSSQFRALASPPAILLALRGSPLPNPHLDLPQANTSIFTAQCIHFILILVQLEEALFPLQWGKFSQAYGSSHRLGNICQPVFALRRFSALVAGSNHLGAFIRYGTWAQRNWSRISGAACRVCLAFVCFFSTSWFQREPLPASLFANPHVLPFSRADSRIIQIPSGARSTEPAKEILVFSLYILISPCPIEYQVTVSSVYTVYPASPWNSNIILEWFFSHGTHTWLTQTEG